MRQAPYLCVLLCISGMAAAGHAMDATPEASQAARATCTSSGNDHPQARNAEPAYAADAVRADLRELMAVIDATHPDPALSFDRASLDALSRQLAEDMADDLSVRHAWLALARLNPHFHDAHTGLRHPVREYERHLAAGGAAFPAIVFVDRQGVLRAMPDASPESGLQPDDRIVAINGHATDAIVAELMPRMRGETDSIRRLVLSFHFPAYLWAMLGPQRAFCVEIASHDGTHRRAQLHGDAGEGDRELLSQLLNSVGEAWSYSRRAHARVSFNSVFLG
jgi:hypothetical protein